MSKMTTKILCEAMIEQAENEILKENIMLRIQERTELRGATPEHARLIAAIRAKVRGMQQTIEDLRVILKEEIAAEATSVIVGKDG